MRKRTVNQIMTLVGGIAIVVTILAFNTGHRLYENTKEHREWRVELERRLSERGLEVTSWDLFRETRGTFRTGPRVSEQLALLEGQRIRLVGYAIPFSEALRRYRPPATALLDLLTRPAYAHSLHAETYSGQDLFLFAPYPTDCYLNEQLHIRDVILVIMAEEAPAEFIIEEPTVLQGTLALNRNLPGRLFYVLQDAVQGAETGAQQLPEFP